MGQFLKLPNMSSVYEYNSSDYSFLLTVQTIQIIFSSISLIICCWILGKIFINLYEFKCIGIQFSEVHNWIIEPSSINKISALLSTIFFSLFQVSSIILHILHLSGLHPIFQISSNTILFIAYISYILYLISLLHYNINTNEFIKSMVPSYVIPVVIGCLIPIYTATWIVYQWAWYSSDGHSYYLGVPYFVPCTIGILFSKDIITMMMVVLYYRGLNNFSHHYFSKNWREYDEFGDNQRTHELLLVITRCSVSFIVAFISMVIRFLMEEIYVLTSGSYQVRLILSCVVTVMVSVETITYCLSIHFIYSFGHVHYEKLYGCCHRQMYQSMQKLHQKQVGEQTFDGNQWQPNCCCMCFQK